MKIKEALQRQQEYEFEMELGYLEWLREKFTEPTEKQINEMERDFLESLAVSNRIVTHRPLNNIHYYPQQGA